MSSSGLGQMHRSALVETNLFQSFRLFLRVTTANFPFTQTALGASCRNWSYLDESGAVCADVRRGISLAKVMRPDWNSYFMSIANVASTRSTCDRKAVGAVIVKDFTILATGYNGSIRGQPHCDEVGHLIVNNHCVRTVHAETNAIAQAACHGAAIKGATLYCNTVPCWECFRVVANAGITKIFYLSEYGLDPWVRDTAEAIDLPLIRLG